MDQDIIQKNLKALLQQFDESEPEGRPITGAWHMQETEEVHFLIASGDLKQSVCTYVGYAELVLSDLTALVKEMGDAWTYRNVYDLPRSREFIQTKIPSLGEVA